MLPASVLLRVFLGVPPCETLPAYRRPNSFSISAFDSLRKVGRPWLHVAARGVASIWRSSASISAPFNRRPARIEPWQASRAITASSRAFQRRGLVELLQFVGQIAQQRPRLGRAERGRQGAHQHRTRAERLDLQAEAGQFGAARQQAGASAGGRSTTAGSSSGCDAHAAVQHLLAQRLMRQALMRGVLIDQHQRAVRGDRDHVGVQHLRHRRAQGVVRYVSRCGVSPGGCPACGSAEPGQHARGRRGAERQLRLRHARQRH